MGSGHILWLTENYPPSKGGMAQSCDRIVYGLRKNGAIIHIIHFTGRGLPFKTDEAVQGTYTAVPVAENEAHTANLCWNYVSRMNFPFSKIVAFGGYLPLLTGSVFSRWLDVPLITLFRGNDFDMAVFNPRRRPALDDVMMASETVGCVSREQMEKIRKLYPGTRTMYTPNGIDTADWEALPSERKFASEWRTEHLRGEICLGVFGQIKEKKGIEVLLSCLLQERRAGKFHLMLAGDYDQDFETRLAETGLKFSLLPFLDRNELVKYYAACDGVVISSHYDGMPNVLLEAGALGIPVLASSAGGIKDVMSGHPLLEAYMFYPGDDEKLGSLLDQFQAMSSDDRQLLGNILKEHIIRNYNTENEIKPYIELLSYEKNKTPSVS